MGLAAAISELDLPGSSGVASKVRSAAARIAPCVAVLLLVGVRLGAFHSFVTADSLYAASAGRDLLGGRLRGWAFAPAPLVFPDIIVSAGLRFVHASTDFVYLAYPFVMALVLYGLARWIASVVGTKLSPVVQRCSAFAGVALVTWPSSSAHIDGAFPLLPVVLGPSWHGGSLLVSLSILLVTHRALDGRSRSLPLLATGLLLIAFGVPSDRLVLAQAVVPALACSVIAYRRFARTGDREAQRAAVAWGAVCVCATAIGAGLEAAVWRFGMIIGDAGKPRFNPEGVALAARDLVRLTAKYPAWIVALAILAVGTTCAHRENGRPGSRLAFLLLISMVSSFLATALLGYTEVSHIRRMLPVFVFPMLLAPSVLARLAVVRKGPNRRDRGRRAIVLTGLALSAAVPAFAVVLGPASATPRLHLAYPARLSCLDRLHRDRVIGVGLSDYWNARYFQELSRSGIALQPLWTTGSPFLSTVNLRPFLTDDPGVEGLSADNLNFILPDALDRQALLRRYGTPTSTTSCAGLEVWMYGDRRLAPALAELRADVRATMPTI
jgi:hypothetical protein